jgi:hypothetical protein
MPIQRMQWWNAARAEPFLGQLKAGPFGSQQVRGGHPAVFVADFGVAVVPVAGFAHDRNVAHQPEAGRIGGHDEHAGPGVGVGMVRVGHGHYDGKGGSVGGRCKPLVPVDHVRIALPHGRGAQQHRVGPRQVGFRHREARADAASRQRCQKLPMLAFGPELVQQFHVADVGRLAVKRVVPEGRLAQFFAHLRKFGEGEAHAAFRFGQVGRPPAPAFGRFPQFPQVRFHAAEGAVQKLCFQREKFPFDKFAEGGQQGFEARRGKQVAHGGLVFFLKLSYIFYKTCQSARLWPSWPGYFWDTFFRAASPVRRGFRSLSSLTA